MNAPSMNYVQYREQISLELAARTIQYQNEIALARASGELGKPTSPLCLLADGDSWFDYPLGGLIPMVDRTDIIAQLPACSARKPHILKLAHYGDATTTELGLTRTKKIISAITNPANGTFDAILFSGGGNDVVGDQFCIWLNEASTVGSNPAFGLNQFRFNAILGVIEASYQDLITLRNVHLPKAPIFVHGYDFAIPTGKGACPTVGPWLKPSLVYNNWTDLVDMKQIVHEALLQMANVLQRLSANPLNNMIYVPTQNTLSPTQWANELHPKPPGFKMMASKFHAALAHEFRGRI